MTLSRAGVCVLAALAHGPRHGYAVIKDVAKATNDQMVLLPGTLYRLISQLSNDECIAEVKSDPGGDVRRRFYRITRVGRRALEAEAEVLEAIVRLARRTRR
jgi:DNA-binding PadR family transcriptional regulator